MEKYCPKCFKKYPTAATRCEDDGSRLISLGEDDLVGKEVDERYKVLKKIGQGGMGAVYIAEQSLIGRRVALKVLLSEIVKDESIVKRFLIEAKAIAALSNAHTITLYDFGVTAAGLLYFTMELVEGVDLSKIIKRDGPMGYQRATALILQVCESLEEAHQKGILHRDIKPDNLMITDKDGAEWVTVLDFGIAKLHPDDTIEQVTKTGMLCGTPAYLSPEQVTGKPATPASDLYSLGIILYEMLTGKPPFLDPTPINVLMKHVNETPAPVHQVRPDLAVPMAMHDFLQVALRKDPEKRYQSVEEFRTALRLVLKRIDGVPAAPTAMDPEITVPTEPQETPSPDDSPVSSSVLPPTTPDRSDRDQDQLSGFEPTMDAIDTRGAGLALPTEDQLDPAFQEAASWPDIDLTRRKPLLYISILIALILTIALAIWRPWEHPQTTSDPSRDQARRAQEATEALSPPADQLEPATEALPATLTDVTSDPDATPKPNPNRDQAEGAGVDRATLTDVTSDPDIVLPPDITSEPDIVTLPVIISATPDHVRCRWDDQPKSAGKEVPFILQLTPDDDGRHMICSRPGWGSKWTEIHLNEVRETGKLMVRLHKVLKKTQPKPEPPKPDPPVPEPPGPKPEDTKSQPEDDPWADI